MFEDDFPFPKVGYVMLVSWMVYMSFIYMSFITCVITLGVIGLYGPNFPTRRPGSFATSWTNILLHAAVGMIWWRRKLRRKTWASKRKGCFRMFFFDILVLSLGGGFNYFLFSSLFGEDSRFE